MGGDFLYVRNKDVLFRTEDTVAGIAQTRNDIALIIQGIVEGCDVDADVGMVGIDLLDALGSRYQAHELNVLDALSLSRVMAAEALPPVASMGSTMMKSRFSTSGSLQ